MSELFPLKTMVIEVFQCTDEKKIAEFNRWYDKKRIPAIRQIHGVASVHRYKAIDFDYGEMTPDFFHEYMKEPVRYMTIYRINGRNPLEIMEEIKALNEHISFDCMKILEFSLWDFFATRQRIQPLLRQPQTHLPDGMPEMMALIPNQGYKKDLEEIDDWWLYTHAHDLMETPGYVQCSRYHNITPAFTEGDSLGLNFYEIDSDDPVNLPIMKNLLDDKIRSKEGRIMTYLKNPKSHKTYLCGTFQHWDIMSAF